MPAHRPGKPQAAELLSRAGLRRTQPREAVLRVLAAASGALAHGQIMARLGPRRPDRVSVYRALDAFAAAGLVHAVEAGVFPGNTGRLFELADRCAGKLCHPHFTCRVCQRTSCLPAVRLPLVRAAGCRVERQQVHLEGVCRQCAGS